MSIMPKGIWSEDCGTFSKLIQLWRACKSSFLLDTTASDTKDLKSLHPHHDVTKGLPF